MSYAMTGYAAIVLLQFAVLFIVGGFFAGWAWYCDYREQKAYADYLNTYRED